MLEPLTLARAQRPPLPEAYALAAEVWMNSEAAFGPPQLALLDEGLRLFPRDWVMVYAVARLDATKGRYPEALALAARGAQQASTADLRDHFARLEKILRTLPEALLRQR